MRTVTIHCSACGQLYTNVEVRNEAEPWYCGTDCAQKVLQIAGPPAGGPPTGIIGRLAQIEVWAIAWREYWREHEEIQKQICSYYEEDTAKERIKKYQDIIDLVTGKMKLEMPPKSWLAELRGQL